MLSYQVIAVPLILTRIFIFKPRQYDDQELLPPDDMLREYSYYNNPSDNDLDRLEQIMFLDYKFKEYLSKIETNKKNGENGYTYRISKKFIYYKTEQDDYAVNIAFFIPYYSEEPLKRRNVCICLYCDVNITLYVNWEFRIYGHSSPMFIGYKLFNLIVNNFDLFYSHSNEDHKNKTLIELKNKIAHEIQKFIPKEQEGNFEKKHFYFKIIDYNNVPYKNIEQFIIFFKPSEYYTVWINFNMAMLSFIDNKEELLLNFCLPYIIIILDKKYYKIINQKLDALHLLIEMSKVKPEKVFYYFKYENYTADKKILYVFVKIQD